MSEEQVRAALAFDVAAHSHRLREVEQRLTKLESQRAGERLEEAERRLNLHDGRVTKLEKDEQFCWTVATDCDQRLREIEQRPPETPSQQVQAEREADLSLLRGASAALVKMNQRADFLQAENEQLRAKLAEADEEIGQMSRRLDKKRTELSQMANAYASEKHLAETMADRCETLAERNKALREGANRLEAELVSERKCRDAASQSVENLNRTVEHLLARIGQLKEELETARSAGLSIGNAALKYGWAECEKAICAWLAKNPHIGGNVNIYDSLAADIRAGDHRPEGFDPTDRASGMGQDDSRVQAGQFKREVKHQELMDATLEVKHQELMTLAQISEQFAAKRREAGFELLGCRLKDCYAEPEHTGADEIVPEEGRDPFAYPAGLPEEDPGSAPEPLPLEEVRLGTVAAGMMLVDPEPLKRLADSVMGEVHGWNEWESGMVIAALRQAGVIPEAQP